MSLPSIEELARAFEAWETGYRIHPEKFRSQEQIVLLGVSQVSKERAEYFFGLLNGLQLINGLSNSQD